MEADKAPEHLFTLVKISQKNITSSKVVAFLLLIGSSSWAGHSVVPSRDEC